MTTQRFHLAAALIAALALLLRIIYHLGADPLTHIAGDINDYVHYAWNLGHHGVYSSAPIDPSAIPKSDSFRPPGFPLFLLLSMWFTSFGTGWLKTAYALQILLSSATVLITILLGREWMKPAYALTAGLLLALWPHHIVFASTLLSETLLAFCLVLALWLTAVAKRKASVTLAVAAGLAFGAATLVNSLVTLFPILVAMATWSHGMRKQTVVLLATFILLPMGWALLSPASDEENRTNAHRAVVNFVQGTWPQYHEAWQARNHDVAAKSTMYAIDAEISLVTESRRAGIGAIAERMSHEPTSYVRWYVIEKPYLLWDWDIRLGWGGAHFLPVEATPLERHPVLLLAHDSIKAVNPGLFALAGFSSSIFILSWIRRRPLPFAGLLVALFVIYVTCLHAALQAEPRYSIPYRPEQLLLACSALSMVIAWAVGVLRTSDKRQPDTWPRGPAS